MKHTFLECPKGWFGVECNSTCPDGYYGVDCTESCNCSDDQICDDQECCGNNNTDSK